MASRFTTNEQVLRAVEDRANGNRPLTSKALLQCRIGEIWAKRQNENTAFEAWQRQVLKVRG